MKTTYNEGCAKSKMDIMKKFMGKAGSYKFSPHSPFQYSIDIDINFCWSDVWTVIGYDMKATYNKGVWP